MVLLSVLIFGTAQFCNFVAAQDNSIQQQVADAEITAANIAADIQFLADDLLEGRGPGTRGDKLAMRYIQTQFELMGLQPAAPGGGWVQPVPLVDTNWADRRPRAAQRRDKFPDSILDFFFVAKEAKDWTASSRILVQNGDLPDTGRGNPCHGRTRPPLRSRPRT